MYKAFQFFSETAAKKANPFVTKAFKTLTDYGAPVAGAVWQGYNDYKDGKKTPQENRKKSNMKPSVSSVPRFGRT